MTVTRSISREHFPKSNEMYDVDKSTMVYMRDTKTSYEWEMILGVQGAILDADAWRDAGISYSDVVHFETFFKLWTGAINTRDMRKWLDANKHHETWYVVSLNRNSNKY